MADKPQIIIAVNTGSSSLKLAVFASDTLEWLLDITVENIGQPTSTLTITLPSTNPLTEEQPINDHAAALRLAMERMVQHHMTDNVVAIGYRLVHGGTTYVTPTPIETLQEADWTYLSRLDPQHTPQIHQITVWCRKEYPFSMHIACFDTAFFHALPKVASMLPIPKKYYAAGVRRYGFHGLSYTSLLETFRQQAGDIAVNGRVILAHLGSGASVCAVQFGQPIDTTMSLTPTSGIPMSTRSGDLDPHTFSFLHHQNNMSLEEFNHMVGFESGLKGISDLTGDMRQLLAIEHKNDDTAIAIESFVRSVKKSIGAFAALLGGVDSLIFSGGIGEQSVVLRERICQGLDYMGIDIDQKANEEHAFLISSAQSKAGVHVIKTDEARVIAKLTLATIAKSEQS